MGEYKSWIKLSEVCKSFSTGGIIGLNKHDLFNLTRCVEEMSNFIEKLNIKDVSVVGPIDTKGRKGLMTIEFADGRKFRWEVESG